MTVTQAAARNLAQELTARNDLGESWRKIAESYGPMIKAGTLCRIAREQGAWLPKDRAILAALGLVHVRASEPQPDWLKRRKKAIRRMARDTKKAVLIDKEKVTDA